MTIRRVTEQKQPAWQNGSQVPEDALKHCVKRPLLSLALTAATQHNVSAKFLGHQRSPRSMTWLAGANDNFRGLDESLAEAAGCLASSKDVAQNYETCV